MQKTMEPGAQATLHIHDTAFGGDGVGRLDELAVFVPFSAEGDRVEVELVQVKPRFARARIQTVVEPAATRVEPVCPVYGVCAGCQYQHLAYTEQLRVKQHQVRTLLQRIGRIEEPVVHPIVPAPDPWAYRTRITLHGPGRPAYIGIDHAERVAIERCPIAREEINQALHAWNEAHPEGLGEREHLDLRVDADGKVWSSTRPGADLLQQKLLRQRFKVPQGSFFQVHPAVAGRLATQVREEVRQSRAKTLIDAYAGVGLFALLAAPSVERVFAIESDAPAVQAAKENARDRGIRNVHWTTDKVERGLQQVLARVQGAQTACVLDPPRAGCPPEVMQALTRAQVERVLYVSCAPDRLARDLRTWLEHGYRLKHVWVYDLFPQTAHIETLAVLTRAPEA